MLVGKGVADVHDVFKFAQNRFRHFVQCGLNARTIVCRKSRESGLLYPFKSIIKPIRILLDIFQIPE